MNNSKIYQYEQRIKYLESRIYELENELHMSKCLGNRQIRKPSSKRDEVILALNEIKSKKKKTQRDKDTIEVLEVVLKNLKH